MRYVELTIQDPSGQVWYPDQQGLGFTKQAASWGASFSSLYTPWVCNGAASSLVGKPNPSALHCEFDLPLTGADALQGPGTFRIFGLGVRALAQASNLNPIRSNGVFQFKTWTLRAGMSAGLPLANPSQANVLAGGIVYQAFGNWEDVNQTLDLILQNGPGPVLTTAISWNWAKGQSLTSALQQMFAQAFPGYTASINISENLAAPSTQTGVYQNIGAFAKWLLGYTKSLGSQQYGSGYPGVTIIPKNNGITVIDGTLTQNTVPLAFQDLIGQPTWISSSEITFATVMRGDINVGDMVTFPTGTMAPFALTTPEAAVPDAPATSSTSFQGSFVVNEIHHYGALREPQASSWSTVFKAFVNPGATPELGVDLLD